MSADPAVILVVEFAIAWLFMHGAWHKLRAPGDFIRTLASYRLLPVGAGREASAMLLRDAR